MHMMGGTPALAPTMVSRKLQVLAFIELYFEKHGEGPSLGEIGNALGVSRQCALEHVNLLEAEGRIRRTRGVARSIRPLTAEEEAKRRLEAAGYAVTNSGLPLVPDLDHAPEDGEESETGEDSAAAQGRDASQTQD